MNNRIMAMLCALVAAMFLSIVPVKAEAACKHVDKNKDYVCDTCKTHVHQLVKIDEVKATCVKDGNVAHYYCDGCKSMYEDEAATKQIQDGDQLLKATDHDLEWTVTETTHKRACKNCGYIPVAEAKHTLGKVVDNGDGTHTRTCTVEGCTYTLTEEHTDKKGSDCVCDSCKAEMAHTYGEWGKDSSGHWKNCTVCGKVHDNGDHTYGKAVPEKTGDKPTHKVICEVCGYEAEYYCIDSTDDNDCVCDECGQAVPHSVENLDYVKGKVESCKEDGYHNHYKCPYCGKTFWTQGDGVVECDPTIKKLDHNWKMSTDDENHFYICTREGCDAKKDVEAHTFKYTSDGETHSATCTVCGRKPAALQEVSHNYVLDQKSEDGVGRHKMICADCKKIQWLDCVDENGDCKCDVCDAEMPHNSADLTYVAAKDPTCTEDGNKDYFLCEHCGGKFWADGSKRTDIVVPATGHNWSYKQILNNKHLAYCKTCKTYELLDHEDTNGDCMCDIKDCTALVHSHRLVIHAEVPATCEEDGTEAYYTYQDCGKMFDLDQNPIKEPKVIKATGHDLSDEWVPGENGQHVRKCANCDYCEAEDHVFKNGNVTCAICGAEENLTYVAAKAATCTEQGNVAYWTSKVTGKKYADEAGTKELKDVTVPATGHELTGFVDNGDGKHSQHCQNPGCKYEEGNALHRAAENGCYCVDCGGALDGHELTLVKAVAATCEKAGTEAYFQCSCGAKYDLEGQSIVKPAAIAKLAHTTNGKVYKDAKEGKHYTECTTCGKKFYEEHVMEVEDPMKGNYHQYVCECGELKVEQHYDKDGDGVCDVCDHSMSSSSVTVEQHDNVTVKTGDASTINKRYTWWRNWLEALFPSNSGGTVASAQKTEETSAASSQTVAPAANSASQNTNQNTTASSGTTAGETVVNTNALTQFVSWFLGLFGF